MAQAGRFTGDSVTGRLPPCGKPSYFNGLAGTRARVAAEVKRHGAVLGGVKARVAKSQRNFSRPRKAAAQPS